MTLLDLLDLLRRHKGWVLAIPLACAIICGAVVAFLPAEYETEATFSVSAEPAAAGAIASSHAAEVATQQGVEAEAAANTSTRVVTITVAGNDAEDIIDAANEISSLSIAEVNEKFTGRATAIVVADAAQATDVSPSVTLYALVALLGGLFAVVCLIVLADMVKNPLRNADEIEEVYEVRCLGESHVGGGHAGENALLANVRFASNDAKTVCVVPLSEPGQSIAVAADLSRLAAGANQRVVVVNAGATSDVAIAEACGVSQASVGLGDVLSGTAQLEDAVQAGGSVDALFAGAMDGGYGALFAGDAFKKVLAGLSADYDLVVVSVPSFADAEVASYVSHESGATILALTEMESTHKHMKEALHELSIAQAAIVGFVKAPASVASKR